MVVSCRSVNSGIFKKKLTPVRATASAMNILFFIIIPVTSYNYCFLMTFCIIAHKAAPVHECLQISQTT